MILADVPYVNQQNNSIPNDCGPACCCMLIDGYTGENVQIESYYTELNIKPGAPQSVDNLIRWMARHNVFTDRVDNCTFKSLQYWIDNKRPFIALIDYKVLIDAGLTYYKPAKTFNHFVVVIGYDADIPCVVIHDPYWPNSDGSHNIIPMEVFFEAWSVVDAPLLAIVPNSGLGDTPMTEGNYKVTASYLYIRACPSTGCGIVGGLHMGDVVSVISINNGWGCIGENRWVSMTYLAPIEQPDPGESCEIVVKVTSTEVTIIPPAGSTITVVSE